MSTTKLNQQQNSSKNKQTSPNSTSNHLNLESNSSIQIKSTARISPKSIKNEQFNEEANLSHDNLNENSHSNKLDEQSNNEEEAHNNNNHQLNNDKNQQSNDSKTEKDSPAFRLRQRRSTPRKLDSIYSSPYLTTSRKSSLYSPTNSDQLQAKVAKLKGSNLNDVKRNLFDLERQQQPKNNNQLINANLTATTPPKAKRRRLHSPSRSLVEDVDLNVFAENILVDKLKETGKNNLNYLCLRIIEVLNEEELIECSSLNEDEYSNDKSNDKSNNKLNDKLGDNSTETNHCSKQRLLKIYCQQACQQSESKSILNQTKPVILLYLFNEYCDFKDKLANGKIIEIVKFEVKKLPEQSASYSYRATSNSAIDVSVHPFYIELKANKANQWISLISIKKKYEPTNLNLLNVINTQNKNYLSDNIESQPATRNPRVIFSSYVVKSESTDQTNNHLQNTKSPTLKKFMRTITKSCAQDTNKLKFKIKK